MISEWNPYQTPEAAPPAPVRRRLNPWVSMWTQPRATIRQIVEEDPERRVELLAMLSGIASALDPASFGYAGDDFPWWVTLLLDSLIGAFAGVIGLYIGAALLRWTGRWFGGTATLRDLRAAMAWSNSLTIWTLALVALQILILEAEPSIADKLLAPSSALNYLFAGTMALKILIGIWAIVALIQATREVQGFSAWKALASALLALFVVVGLLAAVILLLFPR